MSVIPKRSEGSFFSNTNSLRNDRHQNIRAFMSIVEGELHNRSGFFNVPDRYFQFSLD
uniref:Uncharacterized protein n=1 Tax=Candidatus Kentrum sp. MB TaxID=2138164 RepID=A0A450X918_9GAMM|nr:MAG: hypothetical protein BECKMB1821G_GA0114241_101619 [Candidatus Kentron sp. MB]VFK27180.1 MAG: hypothetical protein BECKMB1821I_GA0114274_100270 [Candidatus Kentron sp. MB]VFK75082.1 MAG: hypothetical protein BECKMB1821H_GA0114242_101519 [Candidatus Kentron sp. MB]